MARYYLGTFLFVFAFAWLFSAVTATEVFLFALAAAGLVGCMLQGMQAQRLEQEEQHYLQETSDGVLGESL